MVAAVGILFLAFALAPAVSAEPLNGSIYEAQGVVFMFSVSDQTLVVSILTFGPGGNGRWFAAFGTIDGISGTGQIISPSGFTLTLPPGASMQFQLDQPEALAGSFAITEFGSLLPPSGRFTRIFP